jgi:hypothetical protein
MSNTPSPIEVQKYLGGVDYPAKRSDLVAKAKESGAGAEVIDALEGLADEDYDSPTAVSSAVSKGS